MSRQLTKLIFIFFVSTLLATGCGGEPGANPTVPNTTAPTRTELAIELIPAPKSGWLIPEYDLFEFRTQSEWESFWMTHQFPLASPQTPELAPQLPFSIKAVAGRRIEKGYTQSIVSVWLTGTEVEIIYRTQGACGSSCMGDPLVVPTGGMFVLIPQSAKSVRWTAVS
jgi:hypothetical protein